MIGYVILAHHRFGQLRRLVDRLASPASTFFIHIDAGATVDANGREHLASLGRRADVRLIPRQRSSWGSFGIVRATLEGLRMVAEDRACDRAVFLTGMDYPLRSVDEITAFYADHPDEIFLEAVELPDPARGQRGGCQRFEDLHLHVRGKRLRVPVARMFRPRSIPGDRTPYLGSAYFSLPVAAIERIHRILRDEPRLARFYARTFIPDEMFFQTLVMNDPHAGPVVHDTLRFEIWGHGDHPKTLDAGDFPTIAASGKLFGKKFDVEHDTVVLDRIDAELLRT